MHDIGRKIYALLGTHRLYTESEIEDAALILQRRLPPASADYSYEHLLEAFNDPVNPVSGLELTILKIKAEQARMDGDINLAQSLNIALACCEAISSLSPNLPNGRVLIEKTGFVIPVEETYNQYKNIITHLDVNEYILILYEEAQTLVPMLEETQIPFIFSREVEEKGYIFKYLISNSVTAQGGTGRYIVERIGFLIHIDEMFNHYKNVINHLCRDEYILILNEGAKTLVPLLEEMQIPYIFFREVEERDYAFRYLVSNHVMARGKTGNWVIQEIGLKNIRFMYALGKSQWNYSDWNCAYDLILCFGPHQVNKLAFCKDAKIIQMGYPRYDNFFTENIDKNHWFRKYNCDPAKKTIVWLPTAGSLSSVKTFCPTIAGLKSLYNIVVKPHPLSLVADATDIELLKEQGFNAVIDELIDNSYLFYIADYVFSDYGGTAFGAIYTDRNLVLLNIADAENNDLTGIDSADIALRQSIINIEAEQGDNLRSILSDPQVWETQKQARSQLRSMFFAPYYGNASEITADILKYLDQILAIGESSTAVMRRESAMLMLTKDLLKLLKHEQQTVQELTTRENELRRHLQEMQNSRAWRIAQFLRRLRTLVLFQRNRY